MRNLTLFSLFTCLLSACSTNATGHHAEDNFNNAIMMTAVGFVCIILGLVIGSIVARRKYARQKRRSSGNSENAHYRSGDTDALNTALSRQERMTHDLETRIRICETEKGDLKRQLDEADQLSKARFKDREQSFMQEQAHKAGDRTSGNITTAYYLKPSKDGTFKESSKVNRLADALYELIYYNEQPSEGTLAFVDSADNVFGALQNEDTWLLIVCERSNFPTPQTKSIRTDVPGKAIFKDGEWQVIQKAMITYL